MVLKSVMLFAFAVFVHPVILKAKVGPEILVYRCSPILILLLAPLAAVKVPVPVFS